MPQDLLADFHRQQEEQRRRLQVQVASTQDHDPDRAARIWAVSAGTGLPNEIVDADLENLESKLKNKSYSFEDYTDEETGSPIFNELATEDPYNWAVLKRDRQHMGNIERTINSIGLAGRAGWGTIQMANIADREIKGTSLPGDADLAKRLDSLLEGGDFGAGNKFTKTLVYTAQQLPIQGWLIGQSIDEMAIGAMAYGSAGAAINLIPGAGQVGFGASVAMGARHGLLVGRTEAAFRLERGLAYSEFRELGFDPDDALLFANAVGGVNAALESTGLGALTKRIPGFRNFQKDAVGDALAKVFMKPTMRHAITRMSLQYGEQLGTEVLTEVMQEATLMAAREHMKSTARDAGDTRPEMTAMDPSEFWDTVGDIAAMTLYGTAIIAGAGPMMNYRADARRARAAEEQAAVWAALGNEIDGSTTKDEAPTAWTAFIKRIQERGPLKEIRFDANGWREYWQSENVDPAEVAKGLGFDLDAMEVTDTDVVIPFDKYLENLAHTPHHLGLLNDFRARTDEMTLRESEQWHKDSEGQVKAFEEALAKEHDTTIRDDIQADLEAKLIAGGKYTPQAAKTQARLTAAVFTTMGARENKDPMQLYKERLGGIQQQIPEGLAVGDVDMDVDPILDRIRNQDFPRQRDIYGASLFDMIRQAGGIQDEGGELAGRDIPKQFPGMVSKTGLSIDGIAELAFEGGYIPEYDSGLLMEAFDREAGGDQVFGTEATINRELEEILGQLEEAAAFLDQAQIDLNEMSNAEVREYLKGVKTLEQSNDSDLKQWGDLVMLMAMREETADMDPYSPDRFDSVLSRAEAAKPLVAEEQDFQDVMFTDKFIDSEGDPGTHKYSAQDAYGKAVKQRNLLKRLMDCVNG